MPIAHFNKKKKKLCVWYSFCCIVKSHTHDVCVKKYMRVTFRVVDLGVRQVDIFTPGVVDIREFSCLLKIKKGHEYIEMCT